MAQSASLNYGCLAHVCGTTQSERKAHHRASARHTQKYARLGVVDKTTTLFFSDLYFFNFLAVLVDDLGSATGEGGAADADAFERSVWTPFPLA